MLGEFGVSDPNDETQCAIEVPQIFSYMEQNQDVWRGYTLWGAGAQWGNYFFRLNPPSNDYDSGVDSPQMEFAENFITNILN